MIAQRSRCSLSYRNIVEGTYVTWTFLGATFFKEENETDKISFNYMFYLAHYTQ